MNTVVDQPGNPKLIIEKVPNGGQKKRKLLPSRCWLYGIDECLICCLQKSYCSIRLLYIVPPKLLSKLISKISDKKSERIINFRGDNCATFMEENFMEEKNSYGILKQQPIPTTDRCIN